MKSSQRAQFGYQPELSDVTVVVPIHRDAGAKREHWLQEALRSLPDGVSVTVARNEGDVPGAVNQAVREASTDWVFPMGADDRVGIDFFEWMLSMHDGADVIYPTQVITDEEMRKPIGTNIARPFCGNRLETVNYVSGASLVRRDSWLAAGGYRDVDIEDWDLWLRMHKAGYRFVPMPEAQYYWRRVAGSRSDALKLGPKMDRLRGEYVPSPVEAKASFVYQATFATSYLRCILPSRYLPGHAWDWNQFPVDYDRDAGDWKMPFIADNVVFQFPADKRRWFMTCALQDKGKKVFVEVDDNYLVTGPVKRTRWAAKIDDGFHSYEAHKCIADIADGVIATTEHLAKQYAKAGIKHTYVCPNMVDPRDWPEPWEERSSTFNIGWFASKSHFKDVKLVKKALEWAAEQDGVAVHVMGVEPGWDFVKQIPWTNDLRTYYRALQALDVGLAPVRETPWSACRSDVKALELAMGGALPILSDVIPYKGWRHEEGCLKAKTSKDFLRAVQRCVQNRDEVKELAKQAKEYVLRDRDISKNVHHWQEALDGH